MADRDELLFPDEDDRPLFADEPAQPAASTAAEPAEAAAPWRILIVDDEADVHSVTTFMLRGQQDLGRGFEFLHAYSGREARTLLAATLKYCREQTAPKTVLTFVCDTGNKYLSKMYNDFWMLDNGFLERPQHGDLRDLILRPFAARDTVVVGPGDLLITAWQRMKLYDVSQLPVMEGDRIVGIVDESDVLLHVYGDEARFRDPVATAMVSKLDKVNVSAPIEALLPVFDRGHVAIVMDGERFIGLITRIDLLNYLRRRVQ